MSHIAFDKYKSLFKNDAAYEEFVTILKQGAKENALVMYGGKVIGSLATMVPHRQIDVVKWATRIRGRNASCSACEVRYEDSDGALVLKVYAMNGDTLAQWDTGCNGDEPVSDELLDIEKELKKQLVLNRFEIVEG